MPAHDSHETLTRYSRLLSHRLRTLRYNHGLTQEQVAERAGIATNTYQRFEKGESRPGTPANPELLTLISLAGIYDITVEDLLNPAIDFDLPDEGGEASER